LLVAVVLLVLAFRSSANLAGAYGVAVSAVLLIGTMLLAIALIGQRGSRLQWLLPLLAVFALLEIAFLVANLAKIADGGWVAIVIAAAAFAVMSTWRRGVAVLRAKKELLPRTADDGMSLDLAAVARVPGAAVFLSSSPGGYPTSFLHNLKHNKVMHEKTVFMTVSFDDVPRVLPDERVELQRRTDGIVRLTVHFGFREDPDIRQVLLLARRKGLELDVEQTSFFTSKPVLVSVTRRGAFGWRRTLFGWMLQNSPSVAGYLRLPPNRVVELGTRVLV
ncbi:MAG TPA: KUP/HAK/KT family potassium transporter, partial [Burkholderiaceae bacterium]|nr:KUP/HAK/KT family potassium transporter [Burkholderiaceae bacterium]